MKKLSIKILAKLGKYDKYLLEKEESNILRWRTEYCDIFESMCLNESNKPSVIDNLAYRKYVKTSQLLKHRLDVCLKGYNKALIQYYAHIEQCEKEYKEGIL